MSPVLPLMGVLKYATLLKRYVLGFCKGCDIIRRGLSVNFKTLTNDKPHID